MKYTVFLLAIIVLSSCKKAEDRACFKGVGEESEKEVLLPTFNKMYLGPHINYILVQDSVEKVILKGGKNLLNFIGTEVADGELRVTNDNKCNFMRSYKKEVTAEIHFKDLLNLQFEGTKPLTCKNKLNLLYVTVVIRDGAGELNLNLDAVSLHMLVTHGWGNMNLTGNVNYLKMEVKSNGFGDAYGLVVQDSLHVLSSTVGTVKVNANNALIRSETNGAGDIWYKGTPTIIDHNQYGTGELVDKN